MKFTLPLLAFLLLVGCKKQEIYTIQSNVKQYYVGQSYTFSLDREPEEIVLWYLNGEEAGEGQSFTYTPAAMRTDIIQCYLKKKKDKNLISEKAVEVYSVGYSFVGPTWKLKLLNNYDNKVKFLDVLIIPDLSNAQNFYFFDVKTHLGVSMDNGQQTWSFYPRFVGPYEAIIEGDLYSYQVGTFDVSGTLKRFGDTLTFDFAFDTIQFHADYLLE